jgi:P-type Ca2+ transporter type 2C
MSTDYYAIGTDEVLKNVVSDSNGLTSEEAKKRLAKYGVNALPDEKKVNPLEIALRQLRNLMVVILLLAAGISYFYHHYLDIGVILAVIVINTIIGFIQEFKAEKSIAALKSLIVPKAKVKREGTVYEILATDITIGDIIIVEEGDRIAADARILSSKNLEINESLLTGESLPVDKNSNMLPKDTILAERKNMVFSGTTVTRGSSEAVVVGVGLQTALGTIAKNLQSIKEDTGHFEEKNNELVKQMSFIAFGVAILTFIIGFFLRGFAFEEIFTFTLAALVSGIPESLPIIIIVVLSISAHRMSKRNAIVRRLPATETLSVVDVIMTDKTGTLTQNKMEVAELSLGVDTSFALDYNEDSSHISIPGKSRLKKDFQKLVDIAHYCNNIRVQNANGSKDKNLLGDPTEKAFYNLSLASTQKPAYYAKLDDLPFNQSIKARASIVQSKDGEYQLFVVGAIESLLTHSDSLYRHGLPVKFKKDMKKEIEDGVLQMTDKAMRTIAFAYKKLEEKPENLDVNDIKNLTYVGTVGMVDPVRAESKDAIAIAKRAGITVIMATGDHPKTALAIARQIGLADSDNDIVYTAADIESMTESQIMQAFEETHVFARMTPEVKMKLTRVLQKRGHIVAMTGDGVNDAPALKSADIGIAMGKGGTDVAREASDIILADDNFATIIHAIEEGRTQFRNIRRTSFFLVTTNIAESVSLLVFLMLGFPIPLLPKQILWLNLVGSGVTDVALATEGIHDDVLSSPPRKNSERILNKSVIPMLIALTITMTVAALFTFWFLKDGGEMKARTGVFAVISLMQIINMYNMLSLKKSVFAVGILSNRNVNIAFVVSTILLIAVLYIPYLARLFEFAPLSFAEFIMVAVISTSVLWIGEAVKKLQVPKPAR